MGKTIERIAGERGHEIVQKITGDIATHDLSGVDIAIDFSVPKAAYTNITSCFEKGIPVVSGTTGWLEKYEEAAESCRKNNSGFIYASNFSLGVNIFFELNKKLAEMMGKNPTLQGLRDMDRSILILGGGLPIEINGEMVGGIGVGGAPGAHLDDACAQAGLDAIGAASKMPAGK